MKYALISKTETVFDYAGKALGSRIVQVVDQASKFDVAEGLTWVDCPDGVEADSGYFDDASCSFKSLPEKPIDPQPVATGVQQL